MSDADGLLSHAPNLMIGQTVSHYRITEKLGEGGMGVIYKAFDTKLDRAVALKFLPRNLTKNDTEQARFVQEAKAAAALNHPNICAIHTIEEHEVLGEKELFIDMELVDGETIRQRLKKGAIEVTSALEYAIQAVDALREAHGKGVIHRDIKSENIMINSRNQVKVMDFGLAKLKGSLKLTRTSSTVGTLAYMAPEQIQLGESDARSDIFSLGIVLFEMLAGRLPFRGEHEAAMMYSILNEDPIPLKRLLPNIQDRLVDIINKCLKKDPADRYKSTDELLHELHLVKNELFLQSSQKKLALLRDGMSPATRKRIMIGAAFTFPILAIIALTILFSRREQPMESVAILPLENPSRDPEMEYLSDGVTEAIINNLSQISSLRVISRSTVFRYKGKEINVPDVGRELDVHAIVTGRVIQRNENLLVSVELVDVENNRQLWGEQYNRKLKDAGVVQAEISNTIAEKLRVKLTGEEQTRLTKQHTDNAEAYQLYLKGKYHWNKRIPVDLRKSIDLFQQALRLDPQFAPAYAGIADAYTVLGNFNVLSPQASYPFARDAALKALSYDSLLAEAHTSLAYVKMYYDWDWPGAEREFKRAMTINPGYSMAHSWYAFFLSAIGRFTESEAPRQRALELDPFSPAINTDAGIAAYFEGKLDKAIAFYQKALEIDPLFAATLIPLGGAYVKQQNYKEALSVLSKASMFSQGHPVTIAALAYTYAVSGRRDDALSMVDLLKEKSASEYVSPYWMAIAFVGLGDTNGALHWLERAYDERDGLLVFVNVEPIFEKIRKEPRFLQLIEKLKLQPHI